MALSLPPPSTLEHTAQLQRVETLHQQLKIEQARAHEFLAKLHRGEELQSQAQTETQSESIQSQPQSEPPSQAKSPQKSLMPPGKNPEETMYCCEHHAKQLTEKERRMAEEYRKARASLPGGSLPMGIPQLPAHVDEKEVRDLEKRVRGLEGRVRGFEGLPPDREMALLEVERLRRELEGLARRREGLFGLVEEKARGGGKGDVKKGDAKKGNAGGGRKLFF
ncbi:hypothetical protein MMC28_009790 [Mycoblastus sanguinarius]|nr:hypothetical protein [Mycoblastus sanguinarius]